MEATPDIEKPKGGGDRAKALLPWVVSLAMCAMLLYPFRDPAGRGALVDAFRLASPWTIPVIAIFAVVNWLTDALATGMTFRHFGTPITIRDSLFVRGATLVFDAVNAGLGQLAIGVVMYRRGTPLGTTLTTLVLLNVVFILQLVCAAGIGLLIGYNETSGVSSGVVLVSIALSAAYLVVIALKPGFLARRKSFAQLFEAGIRGHAVAFAVRVPSMCVIFLTTFATFRCFGMNVPASALLVYVPAIILITSVPVSVQGIGPAQLAQVAFFAKFMQAPDERAAAAIVVAWGLSSSVGQAIGSFLIGVGCLFTAAGRAAFVAGKTGKSVEQLAETRTVDSKVEQ